MIRQIAEIFEYDNVMRPCYLCRMRTGKSITVTLGEQQALLDARLQAGTYEDASEVVRAKIRESIDDPRPDIPAAEVFARLRQGFERQLI